MSNKKLSLHDFESIDNQELLKVKGGAPPAILQTGIGWSANGDNDSENISGGSGCNDGPGPGLPGGLTQMFGNIERGVKNWFNDLFGGNNSSASPKGNIHPDHMNGCPYCPPVGNWTGIGRPWI